MKTRYLLLLVAFFCLPIVCFSQSVPDSVFFMLKDGTVFKLNRNEPNDSIVYLSKTKDYKQIKWMYYYDSLGVVYSIAEKMTEFPGGQQALMEYIANSIIYPPKAQNKGIQETIYVKFYISEEGNISNPQILRGKNELLRNEALRVVLSMPQWIPGYVDGVPVRTSYVIPIRFILR